MYLGYVAKRLGLFVLVIFLAITINFVMPRLLPGDPIEAQLNTMMATSGGMVGDISAMVEAYRAKFGLDQPQWRQYLNYWWSILHLDLGYSLANYPETVSNAIRSALPWTAGLLGGSTLISFTIGTLLGGILAWPKVPRLARGSIPFLMVISTIPYYLLGIILIFVFAIQVKLLPAGGAYQFGSLLRFDLATVKDVIRHALLPATSMVLAGIGTWALQMRGMMVSILGEDFITLAEAKGLKERRIFLWYGLRNALLPQLTSLALVLGHVVAGAILVEVIFSYPGIGFKLFQAVQTKDYFMMQGIILILVLSVASTLLIIDLVYPLIDPRITFHRE